MRTAAIDRATKETKIKLTIALDGRGEYDVDTGVGFLDHMLELFARHGRFDLTVKAVGDLKVDYHHTVEDIGICLGQAFYSALGDKRGIVRYGSFVTPMDESLVMAAVDLSGRAALGYGLKCPTEKVGEFDTEVVREFWAAFAREARAAIHFVQYSGDDSHHVIEAAFKGMARALAIAVSIDSKYKDEIPSTKGTL